MELWQEILKNTFEGETGLVDFLSSRCYLALGKIKKIIEDENLNDKECFIKNRRNNFSLGGVRE